jgi:hypothetical protein
MSDVINAVMIGALGGVFIGTFGVASILGVLEVTRWCGRQRSSRLR